MIRRILIRGATFENKGAEAMIRCVQRGIIERIPDAVGLLDRTIGADWSPSELRGLEPRSGLTCHGRGMRAGATAAHGLGRLISRRTAVRAVEAMTGADTEIDVVADITGYGAGDAWLRPGLRGKLAGTIIDDVALLTTAGVPFIYLPQCWGPFERRRSREIAERCLQSALRLYARDRESLEWLKTLPSFSDEKISLASDIAFTFKGAAPDVGRRLLGEIGIIADGPPLIGIVPNMRVYERVAGEGAENLYIAQLIRVARHFAGEVGCQVAVMPHEIKVRPSSVPDDRYLCEIIADAASDAGTVCAACGEYSSEELKSMIGESSLLVSSRFHSIVAAMSLRVPMVSIAWSHKYRELMDSVGLGEYVVEHDRLDGSIVDLCAQAWDRRAALAELLEANVPAHESSARTVLDEAVALIEECTG